MKIYNPLVICVFAILVCGAGALCQETGAAGAISMELAGMEVEGSACGHQLRFMMEPCPGGNSLSTDGYIVDTMRLSLESFLLGLSYPESAFWVNLSPKSESCCIDPSIADTDTGKILLAADLRLKKDASSLTNPRTSPAGRKYWELLYAKAASLGIDEVPVSNRIWIVPAPVHIFQEAESVHIEGSGLKICLEAEYMNGGREQKPLTPKQLCLYNYSSQLMKELIIPGLYQKVNEGASYWQLRQVYRSLALAQWYKKEFLSKDQDLQVALLADIGGISSRLSYNQEAIYQQYLDSLRRGEYDFSYNTACKLSTHTALITRRYFSGGIDLRSIVLSAASKKTKHLRTPLAAVTYFTVNLDSHRKHTAQYAMESIKLEHPDTLIALADHDAMTEKNSLLAVIKFDMSVDTVLNQNLLMYRAISRNL